MFAEDKGKSFCTGLGCIALKCRMLVFEVGCSSQGFVALLFALLKYSVPAKTPCEACRDIYFALCPNCTRMLDEAYELSASDHQPAGQ